ncbi:hypothetical protein BDZ89DRAFT_1060618 [Hymenopellis radicata]|nr:hypothetical protein BDZ89DRAFT_1060618 [Hymenopellis radicata]
MSHSHSSTHGGRTQTIRQILRIKFPRIHSSEETLVSTMSRDFGPPLSPTPVGPGSKRSRQQGIAAEEDQSEHPLYRELVAWQGLMPGYFIMHLPERSRLKYVKSFVNLPLLLVEKLQTFPGLDLTIPHGNRYASDRRTGLLFDWEDTDDPSKAVETIANLQAAHRYQGQLIAACASAVAGNPAGFTDSLDLLQSTSRKTAQTIHPGSEEVCAAEYLVLNPELPGIRASTRRAHKISYEAVEFFGLSAIQATHIQPICAPLNADFPLSSVVQFAKDQVLPDSELEEFFICHGRDDPARNCRSAHCPGRVLEFPRPFTTSGRPTGVDGDPALHLISQWAQVTNLPSLKPLTRAEKITVLLFLEQVWGVALAADATFITVSGVNEEMIFLRDRASQTLFLSDVLTVYRDPLSSNTPHLAVHVGEGVYAHDDALSRANKLELHRRAGTLPASFRYPFKNEIDLLSSDLDFKELSRSYQLSIGRFLPPDLFKPENTFGSNSTLFNNATQLRIHWDDDDALILRYMFGNYKSPITLNASVVNPPVVLDVKIHCFKQHAWRVFLCHFIDVNRKPYGKSFIMKLAWSPILRPDEEALEMTRVEQTPDIDDEFLLLKAWQLKDDQTVSCRVPRPYRQFSDTVGIIPQRYKFSAYFMEDCEGCYPIGIANDIDYDLRHSIAKWLEVLHDRESILHQSLSVKNILFKPSDPSCFYVVGWGKAVRMKEKERAERGEQEEELLEDLFQKRFHGSGPPNKRARHDTEDEDENEEELFSDNEEA